MPLQKTNIVFYYDDGADTKIEMTPLNDHWFMYDTQNRLVPYSSPTSQLEGLNHLFDASEGATEELLGTFQTANTQGYLASGTLSFAANCYNLGSYILEKFLRFEFYAVVGTTLDKKFEVEKQIDSVIATWQQYTAPLPINGTIDFGNNKMEVQVFAVVKYPSATQDQGQ